MDEADTWHCGRSHPTRVSVRWGLSPTPKRDRVLSPILRVEVENFEIEPEVPRGTSGYSYCSPYTPENFGENQKSIGLEMAEI